MRAGTPQSNCSYVWMSPSSNELFFVKSMPHMKQSLVGCRAPGGPIQTNLKALRCFLSAARAAQDLGWRRRNVGMPAWLPSIGELEARATEAEDDTDKVNNDVPARGGVILFAWRALLRKPHMRCHTSKAGCISALCGREFSSADAIRFVMQKLSGLRHALASGVDLHQ
jgi:hypothetical protein